MQTKFLTHKDDRLSMQVISPHMVYGPWVAGGAPLRWLHKSPVEDADIDVFVRNPLQAKQLEERLIDFGMQCVHKTDNALTFKFINTSNRRAIQIIKLKNFKDHLDIIDWFDFTVCQVVTDGIHAEFGDSTLSDIKHKRLHLSKNADVKPSLIKRVVKYMTYGYTPDDEIRNMIENPSTYKLSLDFESDAEYS